MLPAWPSLLNLKNPFLKSASLKLRVEAIRPCVSTRLPAPNTMPPALIRNTRPLEESVPRITLGSCPLTRFNTVLAAFCC